MPLLFEQQPRESKKAYAAFRAYLDMGPERSVREVARLCSKSASLIARWSAKYDWPARVQAFNASIAEQERLAIQERVVEKAVEWEKLHEGVKREAWQEAEETIKLVRMARKEWESKGRVPGWEGMARMLELAFKLKQFAAGMASEVKEVNTTVKIIPVVMLTFMLGFLVCFVVARRRAPVRLVPTKIDRENVRITFFNQRYAEMFVEANKATAKTINPWKFE